MNFNGINNSAEKAPVPTVEKKEAGIENIEGQIEAEAQKLEQGVAELQSELESVGGEEGLKEKMGKLDESRLKKIQEEIKESIRDICIDATAVIGNMLVGATLVGLPVLTIQAMYDFVQQAGISGSIEISNTTYAIGAGVVGAIGGTLIFPERIQDLISSISDLRNSLSQKRKEKNI